MSKPARESNIINFQFAGSETQNLISFRKPWGLFPGPRPILSQLIEVDFCHSPHLTAHYVFFDLKKMMVPVCSNIFQDAQFYSALLKVPYFLGGIIFQPKDLGQGLASHASKHQRWA